MRSNTPALTRVRPFLVGTSALCAGIVIWWVISIFGGIPTYTLPTPGATLDRAVELFRSGTVQIHFAQTAAEIIQGSLIGIGLGVGLALTFYYVRWIRQSVMPIVVVAQVTPKISIAPLIVLWIGLGIGSKITLVALMVFYPVLVSMLARLDSIPLTVRDLARITGMGPIVRAFRIDIPYSFPALLAGVQLGLLRGVTGAVIGEFIGSSAGLGYLEKQGQDNADVRLVLVSLGLLALLGVVLFLAIGVIERRFVKRFE